jgi:hypothetical protein
MQNSVVRLSDVVKVNGTGGSKITAAKLNRVGEVCLYKRSDGPLEVFLVKVVPEGEMFGKMYPEREVYPSNEDFGHSAWCFTSLEAAESKFHELSSMQQ